MNKSCPPLTKREQIVQAARKLFLESGYETTSMDALATEANVSKRTVYSYFANKEELFSAIMQTLCSESSCTHPSELHGDMPPEKALREFACNMVGLKQSPEENGVFRVVLAEGIKFPELGKAFWNNGPEPAKQILAAYLAKQVKLGVLKIDDTGIAAMQFIGMVKHPHSMPELFGFTEPASDEERQRALDQAISIFLKGTRV